MRIATLVAVPLILATGSPSVAQTATPVPIQLSNFKFAPSTITLDHGRPYVLRLTNASSGGHDFTATEFFAASNVAPADRSLIAGGAIEVPSGKTVDIHLTAPAAGIYRLKCSHSFHKMFGMSGSIVVR